MFKSISRKQPPSPLDLSSSSASISRDTQLSHPQQQPSSAPPTNKNFDRPHHQQQRSVSGGGKDSSTFRLGFWKSRKTSTPTTPTTASSSTSDASLNRSQQPHHHPLKNSTAYNEQQQHPPPSAPLPRARQSTYAGYPSARSVSFSNDNLPPLPSTAHPAQYGHSSTGSRSAQFFSEEFDWTQAGASHQSGSQSAPPRQQQHFGSSSNPSIHHPQHSQQYSHPQPYPSSSQHPHAHLGLGRPPPQQHPFPQQHDRRASEATPPLQHHRSASPTSISSGGYSPSARVSTEERVGTNSPPAPRFVSTRRTGSGSPGMGGQAGWGMPVGGGKREVVVPAGPDAGAGKPGFKLGHGRKRSRSMSHLPSLDMSKPLAPTRPIRDDMIPQYAQPRHISFSSANAAPPLRPTNASPINVHRPSFPTSSRPQPPRPNPLSHSVQSQQQTTPTRPSFEDPYALSMTLLGLQPPEIREPQQLSNLPTLVVVPATPDVNSGKDGDDEGKVGSQVEGWSANDEVPPPLPSASTASTAPGAETRGGADGGKVARDLMRRMEIERSIIQADRREDGSTKTRVIINPVLDDDEEDGEEEAKLGSPQIPQGPLTFFSVSNTASSPPGLDSPRTSTTPPLTSSSPQSPVSPSFLPDIPSPKLDISFPFSASSAFLASPPEPNDSPNGPSSSVAFRIDEGKEEEIVRRGANGVELGRVSPLEALGELGMMSTPPMRGSSFGKPLPAPRPISSFEDANEESSDDEEDAHSSSTHHTIHPPIALYQSLSAKIETPSALPFLPTSSSGTSPLASSSTGTTLRSDSTNSNVGMTSSSSLSTSDSDWSLEYSKGRQSPETEGGEGEGEVDDELTVMIQSLSLDNVSVPSSIAIGGSSAKAPEFSFTQHDESLSHLVHESPSSSSSPTNPADPSALTPRPSIALPSSASNNSLFSASTSSRQSSIIVTSPTQLARFPVPPTASPSSAMAISAFSPLSPYPSSSRSPATTPSPDPVVLSGLGLGLPISSPSSVPSPPNLFNPSDPPSYATSSSIHPISALRTAPRSASPSSAPLSSTPSAPQLIRDHRKPFYLTSSSTGNLPEKARRAAGEEEAAGKKHSGKQRIVVNRTPLDEQDAARTSDSPAFAYHVSSESGIEIENSEPCPRAFGVAIGSPTPGSPYVFESPIPTPTPAFFPSSSTYYARPSPLPTAPLPPLRSPPPTAPLPPLPPSSHASSSRSATPTHSSRRDQNQSSHSHTSSVSSTLSTSSTTTSTSSAHSLELAEVQIVSRRPPVAVAMQAGGGGGGVGVGMGVGGQWVYARTTRMRANGGSVSSSAAAGARGATLDESEQARREEVLSSSRGEEEEEEESQRRRDEWEGMSGWGREVLGEAMAL